ncbi:hypothetical protein SDC9_122648 [bioreactor metagenome]|uniref:Uncharacterized protein n=1 Tax=bioreactor metagenome TaxID=1076179 RepID=A0A645CFF5_9ZZZZ
MVFGAIHVGTQIKHRGRAALFVGHLRGDGRAVDAFECLEQITRNRHQRARVASRNRHLRSTILDLLDGHAHGRILLAAKGHLD